LGDTVPLEKMCQIQDLKEQLASYDNRYAAMAETIERTKMELIQTEKARDYHIEQTGQLREDNKRLRAALGEIVSDYSGDRRYGRCVWCGIGATIARKALKGEGK
jgi:septation ring formation regulator EzrA